MEFKKKDLFTVPNILTYIRIIAVPVFVWAMADYRFAGDVIADKHGEGLLGAVGIYIALAIFLFAEGTDLVDGWVARRFNQISDIGKVLDPVADKLLQVAAVLCLALIDPYLWVFAGIVAAKETVMLLGGLVILKVSGKKVEIMANMWGKTASFIFTFGYLFAFLSPLAVEIRYTAYAVLGVASVIALIALVVYAKQSVTAAAKVREEEKEAARQEERDING